MNRAFALIGSLFLFFAGLSAWAQPFSVDVPIITNPSAFLSDWQSRSSMATVSMHNRTGKPKLCKIRTDFYLNGELIAFTRPEVLKTVTVFPDPDQRNTFNGEYIAPFTSIHFENSVDKNSQRSGRIPDGLICLKIHLLDAADGSELAVSPDEAGCSQIFSYFPPQLILPANEAILCKVGENNVIFSKDGSPMPNFTWTPIAPVPAQVVTYRFRIVEVLPGQSPVSALIGGRPVFEQDLTGLTTLLWPVQFFLPEKGKKYIWSIRALNNNGEPFVLSNEGWAEPFGFTVDANCGGIDTTSSSATSLKNDTTGTGGTSGGTSTSGGKTDTTSTNSSGSSTGSGSTGGTAGTGKSDSTTTKPVLGEHEFELEDWNTDAVQKADQNSLGLFLNNKPIGQITGLEIIDNKGNRSVLGTVGHCEFDQSSGPTRYILIALRPSSLEQNLLPLLRSPRPASDKWLISFKNEKNIPQQIILKSGVSTGESPLAAVTIDAATLTLRLAVSRIEETFDPTPSYSSINGKIEPISLSITGDRDTLQLTKASFCSEFSIVKGVSNDCRTLAATAVTGDMYRTELIKKLFLQYFGRSASASEIGSLLSEYRGGATLEQLQVILLGAPSYYIRCGSTAGGFIDSLYKDLLGRNPASDEKDPFVDRLQASKTTRDAIAKIVLSSTEYQTRQINELYSRFLHRAPSSQEKNSAIAALQSGGTMEKLTLSLLTSDEYQKQTGDCEGRLKKDLGLEKLEGTSDIGKLSCTVQLRSLTDETTLLLQRWMKFGDTPDLTIVFTGIARAPLSTMMRTTVKKANGSQNSGELCGTTDHF